MNRIDVMLKQPKDKLKNKLSWSVYKQRTRLSKLQNKPNLKLNKSKQKKKLRERKRKKRMLLLLLLQNNKQVSNWFMMTLLEALYNSNSMTLVIITEVKIILQSTFYV